MKKHAFIVGAICLFNGISFCQSQIDIKFDDCKTYEDSCLQVGNIFIDDLSEKKFEELALIFSDSILFRALLPPALVTSDNSIEAADFFKKWFYVEDPEKYEVVDSKVEVLVDCLHIYYRIFTTRKGIVYKVEQHIFCEVASGKFQKLSLLCSGPRKVNI